MCPSWSRWCFAAAAATLCSTVICERHRCVAASEAGRSNSLKGAGGETCTEFEQVSLMQVGYHLNPQDEVDDNAAGQGPSVTVADSAPEQSSFISRSAAAAIAVDGIAKNWAVPLHLTQLHVFITREHTSASRSIGGILWTLVGICVFVAICMIGATCFVGFTDSGSDPRDGWMRRTTKGSQSQSPPLAKSGVQQQQKQQQQPPQPAATAAAVDFATTVPAKAKVSTV